MFTAILRFLVTRDAACMNVPIDRYVKCLSAIETWLYNACHVNVAPQERKVSEFKHEEKTIVSASEHVKIRVQQHATGSQYSSLDLLC